MFKRKQRKTLKRLVEEKIAKSAIESVASDYLEENMDKILILIKRILDRLPFDGQKGDIGQIVFYANTFFTFVEAANPMLQLAIGAFPQYGAGLGATVALIGKLHQWLKKKYPHSIQ